VSIIITQKCDGCGAERDLRRAEDHRNGGWREVKDRVHLCAACINKATSKGVES
jgi:hypothetical protein